MTGPELVAALADPQVREQVQRLLGLPTDRVADRLETLALAQGLTDGSVKGLAAAQARTEETVRELSGEVKALAAAQAKTDESVRHLSGEVKSLAAAQAKTDASVNALAAAQAKTERAVEELARVSKEMRQALGALSDNVGFGLEELAGIVLPDILVQRRSVVVSGFERRFVATPQGEEEVDLFADARRDGEALAVVGEVKSRIYRADVERFARRLERLRAHIDRPVVPLMFGFVVHPSALAPAQAAGILLVASRPSSAAA